GPLQPRAEGLAFPIWSYLSCYPARFMASPHDEARRDHPLQGAARNRAHGSRLALAMAFVHGRGLPVQLERRQSAIKVQLGSYSAHCRRRTRHGELGCKNSPSWRELVIA